MSKNVIIFSKDMEPNKTRPVLKPGVVKFCPHCGQQLDDGQMLAAINGMGIACKNPKCYHLIDVVIKKQPKKFIREEE